MRRLVSGLPGRFAGLTRTVAFRLSLWYAAVFTGSIVIAFALFYFALLRGIHSVYLSPISLHELLEAYRSFFGVTLAIVAFGSLIVGWVMAKRALSGVRDVTHTALSIRGEDLDRRVPLKGSHDEIDELAAAFNDMLGRIKSVLVSMKETTDNIAHDLRSPVTRMRGLAEMALLAGETDEEQAATAGTIVEECDRLLAMINTMLDISEAEAGLARVSFEEIDLNELVCDVCDFYQPLAEDRRVELRVYPPHGALSLCGDRAKLQRVFSNLLDNALKYTPAGGRVTVSLTADEAQIVVVVEDTGVGIPDDELPHIFDRFYRGDKSRSTSGNGLGLSLARALVLVHGGSLVASSEPGRGSLFTVRLPGKRMAGS